MDFPVSQFFTSGVQTNGASASASVLPMNIQGRLDLRAIQETLKILLQLGLTLNHSATPSPHSRASVEK